MSFTEGHALCCDCDECINRGGGTPAAAPRVEQTPFDRVPACRLREPEPNGEAVKAEEMAMQSRYQAKRRKELVEFRQWRAARRRAS